VSGYVDVSRVLAARRGPPAALLGMAILIASEASLFAAMIGTYLYLRFETPVWPPRGVPEPEWLVPTILVAVLALTSIPVQLAWRSVRAGRVARARLLLLGALVVQAGYFLWAVHDFADQIRRTPITENAYTSIYYTLLGADHGHVAVGLLLNAWLLWKLLFGMTEYRRKAIRAIAFYWYAVIVLTIVVTLTVTSPAFAR